MLVMLLSILTNYLIGIGISRASSPHKSKTTLAVGITINLSLLGLFKYSNFIVDNFNTLISIFNISPFFLEPVHLPIGISFFTFQAISYLIDLHRQEVQEQKNIIDLGLYIALFPQLIAGPIVRYHDIATQLRSRITNLTIFSSGVRRFLYGLAKKVLIANPMGQIADTVYSLPQNELTLALTWLGTIAFAIQIYFDFSGYSDMAIGLGRMFGFNFLENFNYPYISKSIQEFWLRWHISLSSWFRDYLYIPLGGSRRGTVRTHLNLLIVFTTCGFWHGASWNYVIFGLFHGIFLILERGNYGTFLARLPKLVQFLITMIILQIGFVIFRSETIPLTINFLHTMFDFTNTFNDSYHLSNLLDNKAKTELLVGIVLSLPVYKAITEHISKRIDSARYPKNNLLLISSTLTEIIILITITYLTVITLASGAYNPFIYFRF